MNEIVQYRPAFVVLDDEPATAEFEGIDELLAIPFVEIFRREPALTRQPFHRYSQQPYDGRHMLLAEFDDGYVWWVVGFMRDPVEGLPKWTPKYPHMNGHAHAHLPEGNRA